MSGALDPRTPVLIGGGQVSQRVDRGAEPLEPVDLWLEALRRAAADSGAPDPAQLLAGADTIGGVHIISWRYSDPAALIAERVGARPKRTWHTGMSGHSPQAMLNQAAVDIRDGVADLVLAGGAEAWRTRTAQRSADVRPDWTVQSEDATPTWTLGGEQDLVHPAELARGIAMPVQIYPLFESAIRAASGRTLAEHQVHLSELWSRFSAVAATNPNAWIQREYSAEEIRTVDAENRMVCSPYPKLMNSNSAVEQGAGFILCSAERATVLGVPRDRWVFPWSGSGAHDAPFVSTRPTLSGSPAIGAVGRSVLDLAGIGIDDLAHVDLYSCFPSAVEVAAAELGLDITRPLTVTGGLSFAGGPWNNYVSHSIATMATVLRNDPGSFGLVTANGGFLTKHAMGVYSTTPPPAAYRCSDVQDLVDAAGSVEVCEQWDGPVSIEADTVAHSRAGEPEKGIVAVRTPDGRRAWGTSTEPELLEVMLTEEVVGRRGHLTADGTFRLDG